MTEYALILALVVIVVVVVLSLLGPAVGNVYSMVVGALTYDPEDPPPEPPPECYGSLLLPMLVGATGFGVGVSRLLPKRPAVDPGV